MINIGQHLGIQYIYGAILISGVIVFVIAPYFCRIVEFFPPIVIGSILTTIGINLLAVAMDWVAGGVGSKEYGSPFNILLASSVTVLILIITKYSNDFFKSISVLCGLVAGSVFAYFAGHMSIAGLSSEKLIGVTTPFWFGYPKFDISAVLTMIIVAIISMIESSGVFFAIGKIVDKEVKNKDLANGFRAEGLAITLGSILNSFPYTTFSQNVGLLVLTRIKSRFVTVTAGLILIILGLFPKLAYIVACLPPAVLGGAGIIMFGMVAVTGISMLHEVNYKIMENLLIVATSIGIGVGVSIRPAIFDKFPKIIQVIISDGVFMACIVAIALNFFFNHMRGNKKCN
jgi:xanthine permease